MEKEKGWANCSAPIFLRQSEVLTVWRRLHIERDSMHNPDLGGVRRNTVIGTITNVVAVPAPPPAPQNVPIRCEVTVAQLQRGGAALSNLEDVDQYEHGKLTVAGTAYDTVTPQPKATPPIYANTLNMVAVNPQGGKCPPDKQPFDLHDDDQDNVLPRLPDLGWMQDSDNAQQNLFAMAYIRPIDDGGGGTTGELSFPFDVNTEDDNEALIASYYTRRQSGNSNSNDYWVVYLLSVFQGPVLRDGDPDNQPARLGVCSFVGQVLGTLCGNVLLFYVEPYRDACGGLDAAPGVRSGLQATVVHEVGHSFGADLFHTEGGIMASKCLKSNPRFTKITLNRIRGAQRPGGGAF